MDGLLDLDPAAALGAGQVAGANSASAQLLLGAAGAELLEQVPGAGPRLAGIRAYDVGHDGRAAVRNRGSGWGTVDPPSQEHRRQDGDGPAHDLLDATARLARVDA